MGTAISPAGDTTAAGLTRNEVLAAAGEVAALFLVFIVAFTGREHFGDGVKLALILLSVVIGATGAAAGIAIARRGLVSAPGRFARIALGGFMAFMGVYTIIHVLS